MPCSIEAVLNSPAIHSNYRSLPQLILPKACHKLYSSAQHIVPWHGVQLDGQLYGSLMIVAGQAKRLDLAFDLQADMVAQGHLPTQVQFALISVAWTCYGFEWGWL